MDITELRDKIMTKLFGETYTSSGISTQTKAAIEAEDRHQQTGSRELAPAQPQARTVPANTGLSTRPLTAREAAAAGDPKLLEALRRRQEVATQRPGFGVGSAEEQDAKERARLGLPPRKPGGVIYDSRPSQPKAAPPPPPPTDPAMQFLQKQGIRR